MDTHDRMEMEMDMHRETERGTYSKFEQREIVEVSRFSIFHFKIFNSEGQSPPRITPFRYGPEMGHKNSFPIV